MNDLTVQAVRSSLRSLAVRQRVIADNIANVETPGFLAGRADFEGALRDALGTEQVGAVQASPSRSLAATGVNGNNVNLDEETLSLIETNLRYQLMVEAQNSKFRLLRTALGAR